MKTLYALSVVSLVGWLSVPMVQDAAASRESRGANGEQTSVSAVASTNQDAEQRDPAHIQDGLMFYHHGDAVTSLNGTNWLHHFHAPEEKVTMLGVHVRSPDSTLRRQLKIKPGLGLIVAQVVSGSAAEHAGLAVDDVLLQFGDQWLVNEDQLTTLVRNSTSGEQVVLTLIREGGSQTIEVTLTEGVSAAFGMWMDFKFHHQLSDNMRQHLTDARLANCAACHTGIPAGEELNLVPRLGEPASPANEMQYVVPGRTGAR